MMLLSIAGLLHCHDVQAAFAAATQAGCSIPGFIFKQNQVPAATDPPFDPDSASGLLINPVHLYTLPYKRGGGGSQAPKPFADISATAAACTANAACGMFTSDGYIIGAYRTSVEAQYTEKGSTEADILTWQPMYYCTWPCCGTWVADGLKTKLLQPVPLTPSQGVESLTSDQLPEDTDSGYTMNSRYLLRDVCASQPNASDTCPLRCIVACCKQIASNDLHHDHMGKYHFSQCSGTVCHGCEFYETSVAPSNVETILMRPFVREVSQQSAGVPQRTKSGCKHDGSPRRGVPTLC